MPPPARAPGRRRSRHRAAERSRVASWWSPPRHLGTRADLLESRRGPDSSPASLANVPTCRRLRGVRILSRRKEDLMDRRSRWLALGLLPHALAPVLVTKIVSTPLRLGGATLSLTGAFVSILPLVGNPVDKSL